MKSYTGHPDDEALERDIEAAAMELMHAPTHESRHAAWKLLKALHAQRSQREIAARETAMGLNV